MRSRAGDKVEQLVPTSFADVYRKLAPTVDRVSQKHVLVLKGNEDPLVPWEASQAFVESLPSAKVTVKGYDGVGHAVTADMVADAAAWIKTIRSSQ